MAYYSIFRPCPIQFNSHSLLTEVNPVDRPLPPSHLIVAQNDSWRFVLRALSLSSGPPIVLDLLKRTDGLSCDTFRGCLSGVEFRPTLILRKFAPVSYTEVMPHECIYLMRKRCSTHNRHSCRISHPSVIHGRGRVCIVASMIFTQAQGETAKDVQHPPHRH